MSCPVCQHNEAIVDATFGVLPCSTCKARQRTLQSADKQIEFTSDSIKQQRQAYREDYLPMHRGGLDKGWLDRYGAKKAKQRGFTDKEIKEAKYVWRDTDSYYWKEK